MILGINYQKLRFPFIVGLVIALDVSSGFISPEQGLTRSQQSPFILGRRRETSTTARTHEHKATQSSIAADLVFSNIEVASTSQCGSDPDRAGKVNQDACFVQQISPSCPNVFVAGTLDGHGKKGHVLNAFLCERIPQVIEEKSNTCFNEKADRPPSETDVELMLVETFEQVNEEARLNTEVPAGRSGTTCVVCIFDARYGIIYTANVGDSRAILGVKKGSEGSSDVVKNEWLVHALSEETTTKRKDERNRIESGEGRIDGGGNVWYGPVAIAMTRSLGNVVMRRAGIIPTPEVTISDIKEIMVSKSKVPTAEAFSCLIILGTDGIYDVLKNEDVVDLVDAEFEKNRNLQNSSDSLVAKARDRWQAGLSLDVRIDDTTCVLVRFDAT